MAKKFGGDLIHKLVSQGPEKPNDVPVSETPAAAKATGKDDSKMRTSYIISKDINLKLKYIALKEGRTISDMVEEAFEKMISNWEKKNGPTPDLK